MLSYVNRGSRAAMRVCYPRLLVTTARLEVQEQFMVYLACFQSLLSIYLYGTKVWIRMDDCSTILLVA